jgi:hypothetical protein
MYSLQNRTKHEVWSETGHAKEHVLGRLQQRTAPSASHMASDHTDAGAARMLKIDSSRITVWIPSLTTSHNPNALNAKCQMPRPPKITLPATDEHVRIKADSVMLPSLWSSYLREIGANAFWFVVICYLCPELTHHFPIMFCLWNPALTMMEQKHKRCSSQRWEDLHDECQNTLSEIVLTTPDA